MTVIRVARWQDDGPLVHRHALGSSPLLLDSCARVRPAVRRGRAGGVARGQGGAPRLVARPGAAGLPGGRPGSRTPSADRQWRRGRRAGREPRRGLSRDPVPGPGRLQPAVLRLERPGSSRRVRRTVHDDPPQIRRPVANQEICQCVDSASSGSGCSCRSSPWPHPGTSRGQNPAPVENVSSLPPRSPEEERKALHLPPGFEIQLVAAEPDIHKPLNIAFDDRGRLWVTDTLEYPFPEAAGHAGPRHRQDPLRLPARRPGRKDPDVRRRPEHPDRPAALSVGPRGGRAQHPQRLPDARHRRRRPRRQSRGALRRHRPPRHARHDQRLLLGLRRLDLRLPRVLQQLEGPGQGPPARSR